jgi:hypothetical protein
MTYAGTARFTERDEATKTVVLEASGKETRGSGTAAATVRSSLQDEAGQTRVLVRTTMTVTGRPAQFGRGVMAEVGGRIIGKFASNLAAQLSGEGATAQAAGSGAATAGEAAGATGTSAAASGTTSSGATASGTTGASTAATEAPAPPASGTGSDASGVDGLSADPAQLPIEELNLPVRSFNSLRREGVHTVGGLTARTEKELLAIDGLGPQSIKEIKTKLADRGLALSTPGVTSEEAANGTTPSAPATAATSPAASTGAGAGTWDAGAPSTDRPAANGLLPPRSARPQDEDALDLLSVAGLPLLKRFGPVLGALVLAGVLLGIVRRRRRGSRA